MTQSTPTKAEEVIAQLRSFAMNESEEMSRDTFNEAAGLLSALVADAERYRWLRDSHNQGANSPTGEGVMVVTDRPAKVPRYIGPLAWQLLDAAIDKARSGS